MLLCSVAVLFVHLQQQQHCVISLQHMFCYSKLVWGRLLQLASKLDLELHPTHACFWQLSSAVHFWCNVVWVKEGDRWARWETEQQSVVLASMTDTCEAAKAAGNAAWSVGKVDEALRCFTRAIDLAQSSSSSAADKANLHVYYRWFTIWCRHDCIISHRICRSDQFCKAID
jgi:hypothetical protein